MDGNRVAFAVNCTFGDHHDTVAAATLAPLAQNLAHLFLPIITFGWVFGDEGKVSAAGQGTHQRQIATVPPHHFDDKGALMAGRGARDGVNRIGNPMERGIGADRHISTKHIVIDRANNAGNIQVGMALAYFATDLATGD